MDDTLMGMRIQFAIWEKRGGYSSGLPVPEILALHVHVALVQNWLDVQSAQSPTLAQHYQW